MPCDTSMQARAASKAVSCPSSPCRTDTVMGGDSNPSWAAPRSASSALLPDCPMMSTSVSPSYVDEGVESVRRADLADPKRVADYCDELIKHAFEAEVRAPFPPRGCALSARRR